MLTRIFPIAVAGFAALAIGGCNSTPIANDDAVSTQHARGVEADVLANDYDEDGDRLMLCHVGKPTNGVAALRNDHTIVYTPNPQFTGQDEVEYAVTDKKDVDDRDPKHIARGVLTVTVGPASEPVIQPVIRERETIVVPASAPKASETTTTTTTERTEARPVEAPPRDWTSETVLLKPNASTMIVKGPFLIRGLMWSGTEPARFELGQVDSSIRGKPHEAVALPTGQVEFYVPPGEVLFATGNGTLTYSVYKR